MRLNVVIGCEAPDLTKQILARVLHPASYLDHLATVTDAVELVALLNTAEADLLVLDPKLPRLTKGLVKQLASSCDIVAINQTDKQLQRRLGLTSSTVELTDLAKKLGEYKQIPDSANSAAGGSELISVFAVASGSGASTFAANLAYLKSQTTQLLLADLDLTHPALAAQLNTNISQAGLLQLNQLAQQGPLAPAEFALRCIELQSNLRLLPGLSSANVAIELDLRVMDEVLSIATELDDVVIADLGQLQLRGEIADFQRQVIASSNYIYLITAADPISILTTCNWLTSNSASFQNKVQVVINKVTAKTVKTQISNLILAAAGVVPAIFLPADYKLFEQSVWRGEIAAKLKPKSDFAKSLAAVVVEVKVPKLQARLAKQPKALKRLEQAS
jgi:Flp pilus assembly CpaE family ATPase